MTNLQSDQRLRETLGDARKNQRSFSEDEWRERLGALMKAKGQRGEVTSLDRPDAGASAASLIFQFTPAGDGGTSKRYVVRLDSSLFANSDMSVQFAIHSSLSQSGVPVPRPLWLDSRGVYLGRPGYVMEFAQGKASGPSYFTNGPLADIDADQRARMLRNMVEALADFHRKAESRFALFDRTNGKGNWIEQEIDMWVDHVDRRRPELRRYYEPVARWLHDNAPPVPEPVVAHCDYQGGNVLWINEKVSAILDLESAQLGPREHDVAYHFALDELIAYYLGGLNIDLPTLTQRSEWYEEFSGVKLQNLDYHYARACFQLSCSVANLSADSNQDLTIEPTAIMDFCNRRVLAIIPQAQSFEPRLPITN